MRPVTLNPPYLIGDFNALRASRQYVYADVYTLRLNSGTVLAYTNAQSDVTVPPCDNSVSRQTYSSRDVLVDGGKLSISSGQADKTGDPTTQIRVDEQTLTLTPNVNPASPSMIDGVPFLEAIQLGAFDAAVFQRDRWYFDRSGGPGVGGMPMFYGLASSLDSLSRTQAKLKIRSDLVLLNIMMPRNLYQPNCIYTIYDVNCGVSKPGYANHSTVGASPSRTLIPWSGATSQFVSGEITFGSGPNINRTFTIKSVNPGVSLSLAYPTPFLPIAGDAFVAYPGCDRQYNGGCAYFSNQGRYRGHPFVPIPEMAV